MRRIKILVLKKKNNKVKEDETGATYASRRREMYTGFGWRNFKKRDHLEDRLRRRSTKIKY